MKDDIKTIQSVQRAIDIINCISETGKKMTITEISTKLDLNANTARGLMQTLLANGYLSKDPERGTCSLGYEFFGKGRLLYQEQLKYIMDTAYPEMTGISKQMPVTSCLQLVFHNEIYLVDTVVSPDSHYAYVPKNDTNLPLHAYASGKLSIAYAPENKRQKILDSLRYEQLTEYTITDSQAFDGVIKKIYTQGYATELDEVCMGISCVAAPFFDIRGVMKGTLSVVAPSSTLMPVMDKLVTQLMRASDRISDKISLRRKVWM